MNAFRFWVLYLFLNVVKEIPWPICRCFLPTCVEPISSFHNKHNNDEYYDGAKNSKEYVQTTLDVFIHLLLHHQEKEVRSLNSLLRAASPDLETSFILLKNISHTLKRFQDGKIKNMFFFKNPNRKKIVLSLLSEWTFLLWRNKSNLYYITFCIVELLLTCSTLLTARKSTPLKFEELPWDPDNDSQPLVLHFFFLFFVCAHSIRWLCQNNKKIAETLAIWCEPTYVGTPCTTPEFGTLMLMYNLCKTFTKLAARMTHGSIFNRVTGIPISSCIFPGHHWWYHASGIDQFVDICGCSPNTRHQVGKRIQVHCCYAKQWRKPAHVRVARVERNR